MLGRLVRPHIAVLIFVSSLHAQSVAPTGSAAPVKAIYTPQPVYQPEWARQGIAGKGVVLVTVEKETGKVTGARMLESTGSQLLDGAALQAYSQWRFQPGTVSQVKLPIEFRNRPLSQASSQRQPTFFYPLVIILALAAGVMAMSRKRQT